MPREKESVLYAGKEGDSPISSRTLRCSNAAAHSEERNSWIDA